MSLREINFIQIQIEELVNRQAMLFDDYVKERVPSGDLDDAPEEVLHEIVGAIKISCFYRDKALSLIAEKNCSGRQNAIDHALERFDERFGGHDGWNRKIKGGETNIEHIARERILTANRERMAFDFGNRCIYKVKVAKGAPRIYVVWDKKINAPVTVLTGEMVSDRESKYLKRHEKELLKDFLKTSI